MENKQTSFMFYDNFLEAIDQLPENKRANACYLFCKYALTGELPQDESLSMFCIGVRYSVRKYQGRGGAREGAGAPKGNKNASKNKELEQFNQNNQNNHNNHNNQKQQTETETETETETKTETKSKTKSEYIVFGEFKNVKLTLEQVKKLINDYEWYFEDAIDALSSYLEFKGDKYKSHYAVLGKTNWVWEKVHNNPDCGIRPVTNMLLDPTSKGGLRKETAWEYYSKKYNLVK